MSKCNRKYVHKSMLERIKKADSYEELELIRDLIEELCNTDMLTCNQYRELEFAYSLRWSDLTVEGKI